MRNLLPVVSSRWEGPLQIPCCVLLLACCASLLAQETPSTTSAQPEQQALKVVNDSDWAHTVSPTTQDAPCSYKNPAFPGLYPADQNGVAAPVTTTGVVKPDSSEYLIRFQSAKPVQAAIQQLLAMGEKWSAYGPARPVDEADGPTDLPNMFYNIADMITIAVILKHAGPDGTSLFDYGFENEGRTFPSRSFDVWPCAGLRTSNGQVFAHIVPSAFGSRGYRALQLSFPRLIDGKPLISKSREKVEFRLVANQRVFETTFYINSSDVLDGSQRSFYLPSAFTDLKEIAQQVGN
jgi:hypothetical protein